MESLMRARSSGVILKDGIQRADRVCLRLWVFLELIWRDPYPDCLRSGIAIR